MASFAESHKQSFYQFSAVEKLTSSNFDQTVLQSDQVWIVQLYAEWCGHSKNVVNEYTKLANCLKIGILCAMHYRNDLLNTLLKSDQLNKVHVGAIDVDENEDEFVDSFNIKSVPKILIYGSDKSSPIFYDGDRTAYEILKFTLNEMNKTDEEDKTIADSSTELDEYFDIDEYMEFSSEAYEEGEVKDEHSTTEIEIVEESTEYTTDNLQYTSEAYAYDDEDSTVTMYESFTPENEFEIIDESTLSIREPLDESMSAGGIKNDQKIFYTIFIGVIVAFYSSSRQIFQSSAPLVIR